MSAGLRPRGFVSLGFLTSLALVVAGFVGGSGSASALPSSPAETIRDQGSAASEAEARRIAAQHGHAVIVDSETTPTNLVSAMPDGTMRLQVDSIPVRVETTGGWVPVDTSLVAAGEWYVPTASSIPVQFSSGGSGPLARIQGPGGDWLEEASPFGDLPSPVIEGPVAIYPEVLPGVDLRLTATAIGLSEVLVVKSAAAAANPELDEVTFEIDGAAVSEKSGGGALAEFADGTRLQSSTPTWWDSAPGSSAAGPAGIAANAPVEMSASGSTVTLDIDSVVASRPITYPLYIDPDWTGSVSSFWYIDQAYPTQSYLNGNQAGGEQRVGWITAANSPDAKNHLARAFWQMTLSGVAGKHILSARFNLVETWAFNCTPSNVQLWSTTGTTPGATWNGTSSGVYVSAVDTVAAAHRTGGAGACAVSTVGFNATAPVVSAAAASASTITFAVRAQNESSETGWKRFQQGASLIVTYNSLPTVPASPGFTSPVRGCGTSGSPAWVANTAPITMSVTAADADPGNLRTRFYAVDAGTLTVNQLPAGLAPSGYIETAALAQGPQSTVIPAGTFPDGTYAWRAVGYDGTDVSAPSAWCYFTVKNSPPEAATVVSRAAGPYQVGAPTSVRFGSVIADNVAVFGYWWAFDSTTSPAPAAPAIGGTFPPACGSGDGLLRFACAATDGTSPALTVAPVAQASVLWVVAYDKAGNASTATPIAYTGTDSAARDTTKVSFAQGHGWPTIDEFSPLTSPLPDANTNSGSALTSAKPLTLSSLVIKTSTSAPLTGLDQPVIEFREYLPLNRYLNTVTWETREQIGGAVPANFVFDVSLGWILPPVTPAPSGTVPIYRCSAWGEDMLTVDPGCEGIGSGAVLLGYMWSSPSGAPAGVAVTDVTRCGVVSASPTYDESCGPEYTMGWAAVGDPSATAGPGIDTTQSFTASAWLKPGDVGARTAVALSQSGTAASGFTLGVSGGKWQFCVRAQTSGAENVCVTSPTGYSVGTWQFVTGVWDAANQQLRIFVGDTTSPIATVYRAPVAGDTNAAGPILLGAARAGGGAADPWRGQVAHPTVFPGVADKVQRGNLFNQSQP